MEALLGMDEELLLAWLEPAFTALGDELMAPATGQGGQLPATASHAAEVFSNQDMGQSVLQQGSDGWPGSNANTSLDQTLLLLSQQRSSSGDADATTTQQPATKQSRKRAPTGKQQIAELEKLVAEQTAALQTLSLQNVRLSERVRILELVITVKDAQLLRLREMEAGLTHNPFQHTGFTVEEVIKGTPSWLSATYCKQVAEVMHKLSVALPHLHRHPHLLWGPRPGETWDVASSTYGVSKGVKQLWKETGLSKASATREPVLTHGTITMGALGTQLLPKVFGESPSDAVAIEAVQSLVTMIDWLHIAAQYMYCYRPQMILASSMHVHAITRLGKGDKWDEMSQMNSYAQKDPALAAMSAPPVAPEGHWQKAVQGLMLTDRQKLQATVLRDLISTTFAALTQQCANLATALAKLQQASPEQEQTAGDSTHHLTTRSGSSGASNGISFDATFRPSFEGSDAHTLGGPGAQPPQPTESAVTSAAWKPSDVLQREETLIKSMQLTMVKQACLVCLCGETFFHSILSPVQTGMLMAQSFPYMLDDMAILHELSQECTPELMRRLQSTNDEQLMNTR